jgi:hypothetical protein
VTVPPLLAPGGIPIRMLSNEVDGDDSVSWTVPNVLGLFVCTDLVVTSGTIGPGPGSAQLGTSEDGLFWIYNYVDSSPMFAQWSGWVPLKNEDTLTYTNLSAVSNYVRVSGLVFPYQDPATLDWS